MIPQWPSEPHVSHSILSQALQGQRGAVAKKIDEEEHDANFKQKIPHTGEKASLD